MFEKIKVEVTEVAPQGVHVTKNEYPPHQIISIGRSAGNDISFEFPSVSKNHAAIYYVNGELRLEDFSLKGTVLKRGGKPHSVHHKRVPVHKGDEVEIMYDGLGVKLKILGLNEKN